MYEAFYAFREKPFSLLPDPEFLYLGGRYRTALNLLEYGLLNHAGFTVITGETGTGKTTLLRAVLAEVEADCATGILAYTHSGLGSLMPWVLMAFHLEWKGRDAIDLFQTFSEFLNEQAVKGRRVILVIDEAQNLVPAMLEELRLLSNLNDEKEPVLQVILSGQPALRTLLQRPDLIQFAQRVAVDYTLEPMSQAETREYIRHRIKVAGGNPELFAEDACVAAYRVSGGLPRLVNQACDMAFAYGYAEQAPRITARLVAEAARDRSTGGILPLARLSDLNIQTADERGTEAPPTPERQPAPARPSPDASNQAPASAAEPVRADVRTAEAPLPTERPSRQESADPPPALSPEELLRRGQVLRKKGRHKEALRALAGAADHRAVAFQAYSEAGLCYREVGRPNEAADAFKKALADKSAPKEERVALCYELARTYQIAKKPEQALDCYRKVFRIDPDFKDVASRIERLSGEKPVAPDRAGRPASGSWLSRMVVGLRRVVGR